MKKTVLAVLVLGLFLGAAAGQALAQEKKFYFGLNAGVQTNIWNGSSFDKAVFTLDARGDILLGKSFEISPEVMVVFNYESYFDEGGTATLFYPGVMVNYRGRSFFAGLGLVLPWLTWGGESDTGNLSPKIHVGYRFGHWQVTAYMITWTESGIDFLDVNWAGLTLGYRF